ncbi:nitrile hydratase subunit beta [Agrobacterium tumefaciens str. Cherry 2E-2-2]|nr:nitrile hydratase subunit beta [Agrobacterium tumefaciens str. Cherry 2E-2-2]
MNGPHDLGGMQCFGPVPVVKDDTSFHSASEERLFAIVQAMGGAGYWNIDSGRHAMENLPPALLLTLEYWERNLERAERMYKTFGLVTEREFSAGRMIEPPTSFKAKLTRETVDSKYLKGVVTRREVDTVPLFEVGETVRTRVIHPRTHTRLPAYARGKRGVISHIHGAHIFPDSHAHAKGEDPHWLYTVVFDGAELWGSDAETNSAVTVDCWEPYLEKEIMG